MRLILFSLFSKTLAHALAMMSHFSAMKTLEDLNFESWTRWKTDLQIVLGLLDLDIALYKEKPTDAAEYETWEKSNRLSLLIMKAKTDFGIRGLVHDSTGSAKQFFDALEALFMKMEEVEVYSLYRKLASMKFDGDGSVIEHIKKMAGIYSRLRAVNFMGFSDDSYLVTMVVDSLLPPHFSYLQLEYERSEKNWGLPELLSCCAILEMDHDKAEEKNVSDASFEREQSGYTSDNDSGKRAKTRCFSCGEIGHKRWNCPN